MVVLLHKIGEIMKKVPFFISCAACLLSAYLFYIQKMDIRYLIPLIASLATSIKYGYDAFKKDISERGGNSQNQTTSGEATANQANGNITINNKEKQ